MVIAMIAMGMVQVAIDQVIRVISVGNSLMTAVGTMGVVLGMPRQRLIAGASIRMLGIDFNDMFVDTIPLLMPQMTAFEVIRVTFVLHREMPATRAMLMF